MPSKQIGWSPNPSTSECRSQGEDFSLSIRLKNVTLFVYRVKMRSLGRALIQSDSMFFWKGKEFPGSPVVRTLHSHCWRPRCNPWSGNWDPISHTAQLKKKAENLDTQMCRGKAMWKSRKNTIDKPRTAWGYQKLGQRHGTDYFSSPLEGTKPANTLILDF